MTDPNIFKTPSYRTQKIGSQIQQILGEVIQPFLESQSNLVTINRVDVAKNLKNATVWVSEFGPNEGSAIEILNSKLYDIQAELFKRLMLKIIPKIRFKLDTSPAYAQHIEEVIKKIHES